MRTNNEIIHRMLRDKETHVAEYSSAVVVVPGQVDAAIQDKLVACNTGTPVLLSSSQLLEVCLRVTENVEEKRSRYNIALQITGVNGAFGFFRYSMSVFVPLG
jgi:hypothetical protein